MSRDPDHAPFMGNFHLCDGTCRRRFTGQISRNIEGGFKFLKGSRDPDHAPFGEIFFTPRVNRAILYPFAKFDERSFIHSRNIEGFADR